MGSVSFTGPFCFVHAVEVLYALAFGYSTCGWALNGTVRA